MSAYIAAKHGQVGLMRAAAKELRATPHPRQHHAPGADLDGVPGLDRDPGATGLPRDEAAEAFDAMIPLGRHTTTDEIAQGMLYLAADESAMVTSTTFSIDGGMSG